MPTTALNSVRTKILAIDDSPPVRQFIARCLRQHAADYEVITAQDGEEGLMLAGSEAPGVILLDFMLPGLKGDDVCRELGKSAHTRDIPVVLMSGSSGDMDRTAAECSNVVKSISKPFTPELLCATIGGVVRSLAEKPARDPSVSAPIPVIVHQQPAPVPAGMSGHTGNFPAHSVLLAIEQDGGSGVLRFFIGTEPTVLYFRKGSPILVTTRDVGSYLGGNVDLVPKSMRDEQAATGCPTPLVALARGEMQREQAVAQCRLGGAQLFAAIWTSPRIHFVFEPLDELPPWADHVPAHAGSISEWALSTLREVGDESRVSQCWGEGTGVPVYTRGGYERIQQIALNSEELALASLVDNQRSIANIAASLGVSRERAEGILFRFMCLEIFDHWPASLLRRG